MALAAAAETLGISRQRLDVLRRERRVVGARKIDGEWHVPRVVVVGLAQLRAEQKQIQKVAEPVTAQPPKPQAAAEPATNDKV